MSRRRELPARSVRLTWWVILLLVLPMGIDRAHAVMGKIPLDALVGQAELIVEGRVESVLAAQQPLEISSGLRQESASSASNVADLSVSNVLKGPPGIRRVRVEFASMEDSPRYKTGETVVAFLAKLPNGELYSTVGMLQGRYSIKDGLVEREGIPVAEFLRRIKGLLRPPS